MLQIMPQENVYGVITMDSQNFGKSEYTAAGSVTLSERMTA